MIRFLIKSAFWLSLAFIVMPHFFPADEETKATGQSSTTQQTTAATNGAGADAVGDLLKHGKTALEVGKLCVDNPALCEQGASFLSGTASKMLTGSGNMLEYLSDRLGSKQETQPQNPAIQEAVAQPAPSPSRTIPIPTPRAEALRALDHAMTGAIKPANKP